MTQRFEYRFVRIRLRSGWWSGEIRSDYQVIVDQHAEEGWRLVQVFAPAVAGYGAARYADLIFERPKA